MEKLQAALEKARQKRDGVTATKQEVRQERTPQARSANRAETNNDIFAKLAPIEVQKDHLDQFHLVSGAAGKAATNFDILRTKILLQMRQNNWKRLAITSPMPNSGKTTTACNLALGLGRQEELRTLLFDMDLRSPCISKFFNSTPPHSISDVLTNKVDFEDQAMRLGGNVACSMATRIEPDPAKILLADETAKILNAIEERYTPDIVIFDMPSVLVSDDTLAFLKNVDCALIVARANKTRYAQFDTCEREIAAHTNVLGVVLNAYTTTSTT